MSNGPMGSNKHLVKNGKLKITLYLLTKAQGQGVV